MEMEIKKNNAVILSGYIAKKTCGKNGAGQLVIRCKQAKDEMNYPVVQFNKRTETKDVGQKFNVGDRVVVKGHLASYLRKDENDRTEEVLFIYADTVDLEKTLLGTHFDTDDGTMYAWSKNEYYLKGNVVSMTKLGNRAKDSTGGYLLRITPEGETKNNVPVFYFNADENFPKKVNIGSSVMLAATVKTVSETKDAKNRSGLDFHRVIASEIAAVGA